jgi:PTS system ascorbate-specific IIA component
MTAGLLVIAHDKIGTSLVDTAIATIGSCPLKVKSLEVYKDSNTDDTLNKAKELVNELDDGDGVLILTDLYGSTPCNVATKIKTDNNFIVVAGLNLPMLMRTFNAMLSDKALDGGKNGILICNQVP